MNKKKLSICPADIQSMIKACMMLKFIDPQLTEHSIDYIIQYIKKQP